MSGFYLTLKGKTKGEVKALLRLRKTEADVLGLVLVAKRIVFNEKENLWYACDRFHN